MDDYSSRRVVYDNRKPVNSFFMVGKLRRWLKDGKRPLAFFEKKCGWLFKGYILPRRREMFLYNPMILEQIRG